MILRERLTKAVRAQPRRAIILAIAVVGGIVWFTQYRWLPWFARSYAMKTVTHCAGRFCIDLPDDVKRFSGEYWMNSIRIVETPLAEPREGAYDREWKARLAYIGEWQKERAYEMSVRGTIVSTREERPGLRVAHYYSETDAEDTTVSALLDAGTSAVWFTASDASELAEKIEFHVLRLAKAYRPRKDGEPWPVPGQDWTYLELGAITLPFENMESADVPFGGGALSGTVRLNIATTARPYPGTMFESMSEISRIAPTGGTSFLRHGRRAVAGLDFEELWTRSSEKQELGFAIDYPGEENSGDRPSINLSLDGSASHKADLIGLWEAMLPSLRRVGK